MSGTCSRVTSIGTVTISERDGCIISVELASNKNGKCSDVLDEAFAQLEEYLEGKRKVFDLDYSPEGTDFQKDVWSALTRIPYGKTVSYAELAEMSGHAGAYRAAGNANGKNPIPIFIPCHRVIRSDGNIGGYSLGVDLKTRLLRLEGTI